MKENKKIKMDFMRPHKINSVFKSKQWKFLKQAKNNTHIGSDGTINNTATLVQIGVTKCPINPKDFIQLFG